MGKAYIEQSVLTFVVVSDMMWATELVDVKVPVLDRAGPQKMAMASLAQGLLRILPAASDLAGNGFVRNKNFAG